MSPPIHVKAVALLANAAFLAVGCRNMFAPEKELFPGDDALRESIIGGHAGAQKFFGCLLATLAALKLATVFTNPEGTFLRRNIMAVAGGADLLTVYLLCSALGVDDGESLKAAPVALQGALALLVAEGGLFSADVLFRARAPKKTTKGKTA